MSRDRYAVQTVIACDLGKPAEDEEIDGQVIAGEEDQTPPDDDWIGA